MLCGLLGSFCFHHHAGIRGDHVMKLWFSFDYPGSPYFRYKATMRHLSCIQNALRLPVGRLASCRIFLEKFVLAVLAVIFRKIFGTGCSHL